MSNVSNTSTFVVRFSAIHFYFFDILSHDHYWLHSDSIDFFRRKLRLYDVSELQIFQTHYIDIRKDYLIRNTMKTRSAWLVKFNWLKFIQRNNLRSWSKIFIWNVNSYFLSSKNKVYVFRRLSFTNERFIRKN